MSHLVAIAYPDVATATEARNRLMEMHRDNLVQLEDVVVVEKRLDDRIRLHQINSNGNAGRGGAAWGQMWGGLIGLVFFVPFVGMAVGAAAGAAGGAMADPGIDSDFMKQLGKSLQPGGAALFMLATQGAPDKIVSELGQYGGKAVKTSLSKAADEHLREAMQAAQAAQSAQSAQGSAKGAHGSKASAKSRA
jgi:uncharacterized membrane protein